MKYTIFKKNIIVEVPDEYVRLYEDNVAPFNDMRAAYLASTSGCDESSSKKELEKEIIRGIEEEVYLYQHKMDFLENAAKKGLLS